MDPAFQLAISGDIELAVWRVKQFQLVAVMEGEHGKLYSGDCYLVSSKEKGAIFYWIGKDSSIDERTTVAIKAVELDDAFGGSPIQYREKEGYESQAFKNLFSNGIITLSGGFKTGLKKAESGHDTRLYKVAGGRVPMLSEVPIGWGSMNHGDTFVLDAGNIIFVWRGVESTGAEGLAAAKLAARLRNKIGEQIVTLEDGEEEDLTEDEKNIWEKFLKLEDKNQIQEADKSSDRKQCQVLSSVKLYRFVEGDDGMKTCHVKTGDLSRDDLDSGDSFVVEAGSAGVWVWLGVHSSKSERHAAMEAGESVISEGNLPNETRLTRVIMHSEPEDFKSLFTSWK